MAGVDAFGCVTGIVGDLLRAATAPNCRLSAPARAFLLAKPLSLRSSSQGAASFEPLCEPFGPLYIVLRPLSSPSLFSFSLKPPHLLCTVTQRFRHAVMHVPASCASLEPLLFCFPMIVRLSVAEVLPCTPGLELSLLSRLCLAVR